MDVLASFLLLRMTYREGTGPETFSGEDSKPDYRHIEPGCRVIRGSTILGMERNRPEKGALGRGMQWERSSLGTAVWEQGNEGDGQWQSVPGQRSQEEQSGWEEEAASEKQEAGKEAALVAHRSAHGEVDVPEESIFQTLWLCIFCLALLPPSATPSPARN